MVAHIVCAYQSLSLAVATLFGLSLAALVAIRSCVAPVRVVQPARSTSVSGC